MPKTFSVNLPLATKRELFYGRDEREEFEKRCRHFNLAGMKEILFKRVFPVEPDPNNDNKPTPTGGGDYAAQILLLWLGLRHINKQMITEEWVKDKLDLAIKEGRPMLPFVAQAVNAVMASGILGFVYEHTAVEEEEEVAPATEGKAAETGTEETTA